VHISLTQPTRERAITFSRLSIMYAKVFVASILACVPSATTNAASIGFIYNSGSFRTIGVPGAVWTEAIGINNAGVVVGDYTPDGGGSYFDFRYSAGALATFGVPGAASTIPFDINMPAKLSAARLAGATHPASSMMDQVLPL